MKSKVIVITLFVLFSKFSYCQNDIEAVNGFKYAFVALDAKGGNQDYYGITQILRSNLALKAGLILLDYNPESWPQEAKQNPCLIGNWIPSSEPAPFNSNWAKAGFVVKNCKNEIVYQNFETGFKFMGVYAQSVPVVMEKACKPIKKMHYKFNERLLPKIDFPKVEETNENEATIKKYLTSNSLDHIEGIYKSYQEGTLGYYKLGIINTGEQFKAIILESDLNQWKPGEVKAYFEHSSMNGIYSVKWLQSDKTPIETFAEMNNDAIISIEFTNKLNGQKEVNKFIKMFPASGVNYSLESKQPKASGSGFFITTNGIIATNSHVVEGANKIEVTVSNEIRTITYNAKTILNDTKNDVALLQITDTTFKGLSSIPYLIKEKADVGEKVFTIGYPLNDVMGSNYKVTDGIISSLTGIGDDIRYFQISVPLQPGNSGGPLFDKDGEIIGIASARLNSAAVGTSVENVNYAIKVTYLLNLYGMLPNATPLQSTTKLNGKLLEEQIKVVKNYVCLIKIY